MDYINTFVETLILQLGRTVTIFTTSGGLSGSGFTGVLLSVDINVVRLLVCTGAPPCCPIGSSCTGSYGPTGALNDVGNVAFVNNPLGAICIIPTRAIACFTQNAI